MDAAEFAALQEALVIVFQPLIGWCLAFVVAATVGNAFLELYFEFGNWLNAAASS